MALTPDQVDDFVQLTLKNFKRYKWTDISLPLQFYTASKMFDEKKVTEAGGEQISWRIKTKNTGNARNTGLFAVDITKVEDVATDAKVPWSKTTTNWSYDIDEDGFQSDRETIVRLLQMREHDALSDLARLMEENLWTAPTGTTDTRPMGIPFWIQKSNTTPAGGFTGGDPANFSAGAGGVSVDDYARWKNWSFNYTAVSRDDLVKKLKKSVVFTEFRPPVPHPETGWGQTDYEMHTTYDVQEPLERLAETRNDNLGADVARYMNQVVVGGIPLGWVPYLQENETSDPIYGCNYSVLRPFVKKNAFMRRNPPKQAARQHSVREVHIDCWYNILCTSRRETFVGYIA